MFPSMEIDKLSPNISSLDSGEAYDHALEIQKRYRKHKIGPLMGGVKIHSYLGRLMARIKITLVTASWAV